MTAIKTDFVDDVGTRADATYLNGLGIAVNANTAAIAALVDVQQAYVDANEAATATSYVDLATTTDTVTVTVGASGIVVLFITAFITGASGGSIGYVGVVASGANTLAADDSQAYVARSASGSSLTASGGFPVVLTDLTPGVTAFKLKYKTGGTSISFKYRRLTAITFP